MLKNSVEYKRFVWELNNIIGFNEINKDIIFLCIGTDQIIGDSFGPVVGTLLRKAFKENKNIKIIGDLENALTYNKIEENVSYIKENYTNNLIVVLDSALSDKHNVGKVFIQNRGLKYAESLKKQNEIIGNISIKAVVGVNSNNSMENFENLKKVPIEQIQFMSNIVSNGIVDVMNKKRK